MPRSYNRILLALLLICGVAAARGADREENDIKGSDLRGVVLHDSLHVTPAMVDSIASIRRVEPFYNDSESSVFVPKGQWVTGLSVSYTQSKQNNYQFFVLEGVSGDTYTMKISPMLCYIFLNDMGAGGRFSYTRSLVKLEKGDIVLGEGTGASVTELYSLSHNYYGTLLFRNYFGIGNSRRFGFFSEIQLELGGGQSKLTTGKGESLGGTYERNFSLNVGVVPGLVLFLNNYSAIEVNVGVLGFSYRDTKSVKDQIYVSHRDSKLANFKINLFSITFGATFYL